MPLTWSIVKQNLIFHACAPKSTVLEALFPSSLRPLGGLAQWNTGVINQLNTHKAIDTNVWPLSPVSTHDNLIY